MRTLTEKAEVSTPPGSQGNRLSGKAFALVRIGIGWIFLWTFLDATFALGFPTGRAEDGAIDYFGNTAWIGGASPTAMLEMAAKGPFAGFYADIAGTMWLDWLFMSMFLVVGLALIVGVATRLAAIAGAALMVVAWSAVSIWPVSNPFLGEYLFYGLVLAALATVNAGDTWGLGKQWGATRLVRNRPFLG